MTYRWLTDLDQALAAGGVAYTEVPPSGADPTGASSWRTRGRPASTGQWDATGVLCHHTASPAGTSDQADLNVVLAGNGEAPGPISQFYIGRTATVYLVAAGRCNHGGKGMRPGIDWTCTDMNGCLVGIEVGNNGVGEHWPDAQTDAYGNLVAALCDFYGWSTEQVYMHATTGPPSGGCNSKIDPAGPWQGQPHLTRETWDLGLWRSFVDSFRGGVTPHPPKGDLMLTLFQCTDAWGCFLGFSDRGIGQFVEWTPGPVKAEYEALQVPVQAITVEQCHGLTLVGALPQGDQLHTWTGAEFRHWQP